MPDANGHRRLDLFSQILMNKKVEVQIRRELSVEIRKVDPNPKSTGERMSLFRGRIDRVVWKTLIVSCIVIALNVAANYALARGLRQFSVIGIWSPIRYIGALIHPWTGVGVLCMAGWFGVRLLLLSWADLSYTLPVTSFSYVLSALMGVLYLNEQVSDIRWAGIATITLGAALVALTYPETFDTEHRK